MSGTELMNYYQQGKIYKIISSKTNDVYIGSTCENLSERLDYHRSHYKNYLNGSGVYYSVFDVMRKGDCEIVLLETYPCNIREELLLKEIEWILNTSNCVNKYNFFIRKNRKIENELLLDRIFENRIFV